MKNLVYLVLLTMSLTIFVSCAITYESKSKVYHKPSSPIEELFIVFESPAVYEGQVRLMEPVFVEGLKKNGIKSETFIPDELTTQEEFDSLISEYNYILFITFEEVIITMGSYPFSIVATLIEQSNEQVIWRSLFKPEPNRQPVFSETALVNSIYFSMSSDSLIHYQDPFSNVTEKRKIKSKYDNDF